MRKIIGMVSIAVLTLGAVTTTAPIAQAAACVQNSTVLTSNNADTCTITFTATVELSASITFTTVPSGGGLNFGLILPGVASSTRNIAYNLGSNGTTTNVIVTGSGADASEFQFDKDTLGTWVPFSSLSGGFAYTGAAQNGAKADKVRVFPSSGHAPGAITGTLTYAVTVT